jgi:hypothetical protein
MGMNTYTGPATIVAPDGTRTAGQAQLRTTGHGDLRGWTGTFVPSALTFDAFAASGEDLRLELDGGADGRVRLGNNLFSNSPSLNVDGVGPAPF